MCIGGARGLLVIWLLLAWGVGESQTVCAQVSALQGPQDGVPAETWEQRIGVHWTSTPLGDALQGLAEMYQFPLLVDRRVDPNEELTISVTDVTVRDLLGGLAAQRSLGISRLGPVVYLGPQDAAAKLRTLAELRRLDWQRLPTGMRAVGERTGRFAWSRLATPRDVLQQWAEEADLEVQNIEALPHDLMHEVRLPELSLADRLTLLTVQFDLTYHITPEGKLVLVDIPASVTLARRFPAGARAQALAAEWGERWPECRIRADRRHVVVEGTLEQIEQIAAALPGRSATPPGPVGGNTGGGQTPAADPSDPFAYQRFTVREARGTLRQIIEQFSRQLQLEIRYDEQALERAGVSLDRMTIFHVENGTIDDLWRAVLDPLGCRFTRQGRTLTIAPGSGPAQEPATPPQQAP